ncbi:response regulator [Pseudomonas sp. NPDC007930]|uniref:response regulator n=1 Tax=Pseudomonas sp. NPDC007930 TaxID=3364417 RepID=UPI0036EA99A9
MIIPIQVALVEDDPLLRRVLAGLIEELGTECLDFGSADDALIALLQRAAPIDLLITDRVVPGQLDGLALVKLVRQKWPAVQALVMSGYEQDDKLNLPAGVQYIQKPLQLNELLAVVAQVQHQRNAERPASSA